MNNSFDNVQIEETYNDDAMAEWLWRHEMETRDAMDAEAEMDDVNLRLHAEANSDPVATAWDQFAHTPSPEAVTMGGLFSCD